MGGIVFLLAAAMLIFARNIMAGVWQAAKIFVENVMPALFPMMILGQVLGRSVRQGYSQTFCRIFLIMFGFLAGSPAAARQVAATNELQPMTGRQLKPLLCITGVMSPLFFTGSLAMRAGTAGGWLMLLCHWAGALITGGLCSLVISRGRPTQVSVPASTAERRIPAGSFSPELLTSAVTASANALLSVLGAMMLFAAGSALLRTLLARIWPALPEMYPILPAVLWAMLEIGGGSFAVLDCFPQPPLWLLCALCSFGGLSLWLQNLLFVGKMIRPAELLGWRMLHGAVSGFLCYVLEHLTGISSAQQTFAAELPAGFEPALLIPALLLVIPGLVQQRKRAS